jgi:hypothetical protein
MPRCSASVRTCTARGDTARVVMSAAPPADLATFVREAKEGLGVTMSNCNAAVVNALRGALQLKAASLIETNQSAP